VGKALDALNREKEVLARLQTEVSRQEGKLLDSMFLETLPPDVRESVSTAPENGGPLGGVKPPAGEDSNGAQETADKASETVKLRFKFYNQARNEKTEIGKCFAQRCADLPIKKEMWAQAAKVENLQREADEAQAALAK
jgi:hypothetical protein